MNYLLTKVKTNKVLLLLLLIAFFIRIIYINEIPPGLHWDEIQDLLSAQSISQTGSPMPGMVTGILGNPQGQFGKSIFGELGAYLPAGWTYIFGLSWPTIKIPYIFFGVGIIFLTFLFVKKLLNRNIALLATLLFVFNPWSIHFSRTAYESLFSYFFYLLALILILYLPRWKIFYSVPIFFISFLSYFGAKPLLIPLTLLSILVTKFTKPKVSLKPIVIMNILMLFFFLVYIIMLSRHPAGLRFQETDAQQSISTEVNIQRTASVDTPLNNLFINKYTENIRARLLSYLGGLSPSYLFLQGQPGDMDQLSIPDHGPMYLIDFLFILIGIIYLAKFFTRPLIIFLGIILIALLPNLFDQTSSTYNLRAGLMFPILITLAASGIYYCLILTKKYKPHLLIPLSIFIIYSISIGFFFYQYFARMPIKNNIAWSFHERVLSRYLDLMNKQYPDDLVTIVTTEPKDISYQYLFYANLYSNPDKIKKINQNFANNLYHIANIQVTKDCSVIKNNPQSIIVVDANTTCHSTSSDSIASIKDAGSRYFLINDKLCKNFPRNRYPLVKKVQQLDVEGYTLEEFCQKWITNPQTGQN